MPDFELPGAPDFSRYLLLTINGELTLQGPEVVDRSYNTNFGKKWTVQVNGKQIGEYLTFGPRPGATEYTRCYRGYVPGYGQEKGARGKKSIKHGNAANNLIALVFGIPIAENKAEDIGALVGQRQDGHTKIPFP